MQKESIKNIKYPKRYKQFKTETTNKNLKTEKTNLNTFSPGSCPKPGLKGYAAGSGGDNRSYPPLVPVGGSTRD